MDKYVVKTIDEAFDDKEQMFEKGSNNNTPTFTKEEAQTLLDVIIEDSSRWKLMSITESVMEVPSSPAYVEESKATAVEPTPDQVDTVVNKVYSSIVKDWRYDPVMLQVCRKADFSKDKVRSIVSAMAKELTKNKAGVGKSLQRSLDRVALQMEMTPDVLMKAEVPDFAKIIETGVAYPHRIYAFLKMIKE